jgi:phosphate transport system ATP-binding protein
MGDKIEVRNLNAWFGDNHVVKGISLGIPQGKATAIIGPSGCGKSTFVRCMNRMHEIVPGARVEGEVRLDGDEIYGPRADAVEIRSRVGMVFQRANPFPTMSIFDNVVAGLRLKSRWLSRRRLGDLVQRSLVQAALWDEVKDSLDAPGVSLSGGQQQRLCIARALAVEPEVLLMDEPAAALDPLSTAKIEELIHELKERYTIVVVTHNMQQAARVSDMTAYFYMGRLIEFGPTVQLFTNPSRPETEDYITGRFG